MTCLQIFLSQSQRSAYKCACLDASEWSLSLSGSHGQTVPQLVGLPLLTLLQIVGIPELLILLCTYVHMFSVPSARPLGRPVHNLHASGRSNGCILTNSCILLAAFTCSIMACVSVCMFCVPARLLHHFVCLIGKFGHLDLSYFVLILLSHL